MKNIFKKHIIILLCLFFFSNIHAQNQWMPLNGPNGGPVYEILNGSALYDFCITTSGMYRTSNNGDQWIQSTPVAIKDLYVGSINRSGNIFAATSNYTTLLYRSTDNGNSWQQRLDGGLDFNAVASGSNGAIFAGTFYMFSFHGQFIQNGKIFRSLDNGETWSPLNFPQLAVVSMKINSGNEIYVATTDGLFRSANNGASFNLIRSGSTGYIFINSQDHIFIQTLSGLLRSTDNGASWISLSGSTDLKKPLAEDAQVNLYAGYSGDVYRSTDNGSNWNLFADLPSNVYEISSIRFKANGKILVSTSRGIFRSNDYGITWINASSGIRDPQVRSIAVKNNYIYTASYNSISRSANNGMTWTELTTGLPDYSASEIITGSGSAVFVNIPASGLYRSWSNGNSWILVESLPQGTHISRIRTAEANKIYITTEEGAVLRSDNSGEDWIDITSNLPDSLQFLELSIDKQNNIYVSVLRSSWFNPLKGIYKSTDNGASWIELNNEIAPDKMIINSKGIIFAKSGSSLLRSVNGGLNFSLLTSMEEYVIEFTVGNSDELFLHSANNKVYKISKSNDNGDIWTDITGVLENQLVYVLKTDDNSRLLAGTQSGLYILETQTGIAGVGNFVPEGFSLSQNYPNPFNPVTSIRYSLIENQFTTLKVFDILGKEVATLVNEIQLPGNYTIDFSGTNLTSGVYFYKLESGKHKQVKRMLLIK